MLAGVMFIFGTEIIGGLSLRSESVYGLLPFCKHITTSELRYDCIKKILLTICVLNITNSKIPQVWVTGCRIHPFAWCLIIVVFGCRVFLLFFSINLLERCQDMLVQHIDVLSEAIRNTWRKRPFHIDAWVLFPDQMHRIWTLPPVDDEIQA